MLVLEEMARRGGVARHADLGLSTRALRRLLADGAIVRVRPGTYALPGASTHVIRAVAVNGAVGCVSALRLHGVEIVGHEDVTHVSVPRNRGAAARGLRGTIRHREDVAAQDAPIVGVPEAAARACTCLPFEEAVATLDGVARLRKATVGEVLAIVRTRSPLLAQRLAVAVDPRARSWIESIARVRLRAAGLRVKVAEVVPEVGEVDLLVEDWLIVELDGFEFHSSRMQFRKDRRRDRAALRRGLSALRFPFEDVVYDDVVVADTMAVLRALPHRA